MEQNNTPGQVEYGIGITTGHIYALKFADLSPEDQGRIAHEAAEKMRVREPDSFISGWIRGYQEASSGQDQGA